MPKALFVAIVMGAGILFIVFSDPPRTVCDSQIQNFNAAAGDFLNLDPIKKPSRKETRFNKLVETCKTTNTAGGCYELFFSLKQMLKDAATVSPECNSSLAGHSAFKAAVWQSLDLMARLAWGAKPPETMALKAGWFDPADLNLYCDLKRTVILLYSQDAFNAFLEPYFQSLPGATTLQRNDAWPRMLFSVNCEGYI